MTIALFMLLGIGSVSVTLPQAFADFQVPLPAECLPPFVQNNGAIHFITFTVSGTSVSGTGVFLPDGPLNPVQVRFVLDPGAGSSTVFDVLPLNTFTFNGLTAGPHTIVACWENTVVNKNVGDTYHTSGVSFKIPGPVVGGKILPIDMTALFVAGVMTNAFWMIPTLGGIAGTAITLFKVKRKHG